jgi:hypothetical protein
LREAEKESRACGLWRVLREGAINNLVARLRDSCAYIKKQNLAYILDGSMTMQRIRSICMRYIESAKLCAEGSFIGISANGIEKEFSVSWSTAAATVLVSATVTNMIFVVLYMTQVDLFGWLMRAVFLFLGLAGFSTSVDWKTVRNNSKFLRSLSAKNEGAPIVKNS